MSRVIFKHKSGREELMELRYAKILQGLKRGVYMTRDMRANPASQGTDQNDDLSDLRAEYQEVVGKRAFHGWDAETLREKIAEAK